MRGEAPLQGPGSRPFHRVATTSCAGPRGTFAPIRKPPTPSSASVPKLLTSLVCQTVQLNTLLQPVPNAPSTPSTPAARVPCSPLQEAMSHTLLDYQCHHSSAATGGPFYYLQTLRPQTQAEQTPGAPKAGKCSLKNCTPTVG